MFVVSVTISVEFPDVRKRECAPTTSNRPARPNEAIGRGESLPGRERGRQAWGDEQHPDRMLIVVGCVARSSLRLFEPRAGGGAHLVGCARPTLLDRDPVHATLQLEAQGCVVEWKRRFEVSRSVRKAPNPGRRIGERRRGAVPLFPANRILRRRTVVVRQPDDPLIEQPRPAEEHRIAP